MEPRLDLNFIDHVSLKKILSAGISLPPNVANVIYLLVLSGTCTLPAGADISEILSGCKTFRIMIRCDRAPLRPTILTLISDDGPISCIFGTIGLRKALNISEFSEQMQYVQILLAFALRFPCVQMLLQTSSERVLMVLYLYGYCCVVDERVQITQMYGSMGCMRTKFLRLSGIWDEHGKPMKYIAVE